VASLCIEHGRVDALLTRDTAHNLGDEQIGLLRELDIRRVAFNHLHDADADAAFCDSPPCHLSHLRLCLNGKDLSCASARGNES
jgi:hypothetical protein